MGVFNGFSDRIKTDASDRRQVSICGQTFLKNRRVEGALIEEGKYHSPILLDRMNGCGCCFLVLVGRLEIGIGFTSRGG